MPLRSDDRAEEGFLLDTHGGQARQLIYLPLHWELDDCVELAEESFRPLPNLDVVAVGEAGRGSRRTKLRLSPSLGFLQRQQLGGRGANHQGLWSG